jgi:hypothetical protein
MQCCGSILLHQLANINIYITMHGATIKKYTPDFGTITSDYFDNFGPSSKYSSIPAALTCLVL